MLRLLSPTVHGALDYVLAIFFFIGPTVSGFRDGRAAMFSVLIGVVLFLLALITRMPPSLLKTVPFPVHGAVELFIAVLLLVLPWIADFAAGIKSRNYFLLMSLLTAIIWLITDYRDKRVTPSRVPREPVGDRTPPTS